jgi:tetratricopeptide (TPR) repeat protein
VDSSYLGGEQGIKALTANFYLDALKRLTPPKLRRRTRRLCEEGLLTREGRRHSLLVEEITERFKLDGTSLEPLENARLLRKEPRYGSFSYEISHDRLAEAIREQRHWRLPREVKIGLVMFVVVLVVAAALFSFFQAESRRRAQEAREQAEQVLDYIIFDLRDRLTDLGGRALLDDIQKQVDAYYERMESVGESDEILRRKAPSHNNRGNLSLNRSNLDSALTSYQSALAIHKRLIARDPANTEWQTDLVVSLYKIATVLEKQSPPQKKGAATNYERILDILRPLVAANRLAANQQDWIADVEKRLEALKD